LRTRGDSDIQEFVQDLAHRWRYLYKIENALHSLDDAAGSAETEALLNEFAEAFAAVCSREHFLEVCGQNGENIPGTLSRPLSTA
jgi:hypothetical protein